MLIDNAEFILLKSYFSSLGQTHSLRAIVLPAAETVLSVQPA